MQDYKVKIIDKFDQQGTNNHIWWYNKQNKYKKIAHPKHGITGSW